MFEQNLDFSQSFNAKSTTKKNLCESFIPNSYYKRLTSPNHTIMVGPRGSGKTTLLRMCDIEALDMWSEVIADSYRAKVEFTGVFIPTDRLWKSQYDNLKGQHSEQGKVIELLNASFTYHILECFNNALIFKVSKSSKKKNNYRHVELTKNDETELVSALCKLWSVKVEIPSLRGLSLALTQKKFEISRSIAALDDDKYESLPNPPNLPIIPLIESSIQISNQCLDETDAKWAFLFDELELAPDIFIQPLIDAMRGGPQNLLLKLALSPYHRGVAITVDPNSTMHKQDVSFINLSGVKEEGANFAKALAESVFRNSGLTAAIDSYFETTELDRTKDIFELQSSDKSFKKYLKSNGLSDTPYNELSTGKQAMVRRVQFNVHLRNHYRRPRKRPSDYYTGFENVCRLLDYNPRMLIGVMNIFASIAKNEGEIKVHRQLECVKDYYKSFKALLNTIAVDSENLKLQSLYDVIERIAEYFKEQIHGEEFSPNPKGSIIFKNKFNANYMDAIGLALNAGALIIEKGETDSFHEIDGLRKNRVRLSYIFSPEFKLLLNVQKAVDLVEILDLNKLNVHEPIIKSSRQMELDL